MKSNQVAWVMISEEMYLALTQERELILKVVWLNKLQAINQREDKWIHISRKLLCYKNSRLMMSIF